MYRMIREANNDASAKVPKLPLLMVFNDGAVFESDSVAELVCIMAGDEYLKLDVNKKCLERIKIARKQAMVALQFNITAVVTLQNKIIKNNYVVKDDDEDYMYTEDELKNAVKIKVDNDIEFLKSLDEIMAVTILEKTGCNVFLENTKLSGSNEYVFIRGKVGKIK